MSTLGIFSQFVKKKHMLRVHHLHFLCVYFKGAESWLKIVPCLISPFFSPISLRSSYSLRHPPSFGTPASPLGRSHFKRPPLQRRGRPHRRCTSASHLPLGSLLPSDIYASSFPSSVPVDAYGLSASLSPLSRLLASDATVRPAHLPSDATVCTLADL